MVHHISFWLSKYILKHFTKSFYYETHSQDINMKNNKTIFTVSVMILKISSIEFFLSFCCENVCFDYFKAMFSDVLVTHILRHLSQCYSRMGSTTRFVPIYVNISAFPHSFSIFTEQYNPSFARE